MTNGNGRLFFLGDTERGDSLFTSDGTPEGTFLVQLLGGPTPLAASGSHLFLTADLPATGRELYALSLGLGLSVDDVAVTEGGSGATPVQFTITLSGGVS